MATPPTFVAEYESTFSSAGAGAKTASVTVSAGDILVVVGVTEDGGLYTLGTPSGGGLTYSLQQSVVVSSYCAVYVWTATSGSSQTFTLSITMSGGTAGWGWNASRWSGSDGVGNSSKTNVASGAPSLALTTAGDNSAIVAVDGDWNAADGASRTWRTINGITPAAGGTGELVYFRDATRYTAYVGYWSDAGTAGSKTTGLSAPSGQKYAIAAVEVKGTASGSGATATPAAVAGVAAVPSTTISTGSTVSPSTVVAVAAVPAVTVTAVTNVSPTAVVATTTIPAPTVSTGSTVTAAAVVGTAAVPAPALSTGETVTATTVTAVAAVPTPTVVAGGTANPTPAAVTGVAAVPAVTVRTGSTVLATTAILTAAVPAPQASGATTATPAAVQGTTTTPTPTVTTGATAQPAAVAVTVTVPGVTVVGGEPGTLTPTTAGGLIASASAARGRLTNTTTGGDA